MLVVLYGVRTCDAWGTEMKDIYANTDVRSDHDSECWYEMMCNRRLMNSEAKGLLRSGRRVGSRLPTFLSRHLINNRNSVPMTTETTTLLLNLHSAAYCNGTWEQPHHRPWRFLDYSRLNLPKSCHFIKAFVYSILTSRLTHLLISPDVYLLLVLICLPSNTVQRPNLLQHTISHLLLIRLHLQSQNSITRTQYP